MGTDADYAVRVGLVLREARYFRERTREDVASACEVVAETYARWERGDVAIPGHSLSRIADYLELPADLLLTPPATRAEVLVRIAAHDAVRIPPGGREP